MKKLCLLCICILTISFVCAQEFTVCSPDSNLKVNLKLEAGNLSYSASYKDKTMLVKSPLGLLANIGDFSKNLSLVGSEKDVVEETYTLDRIKQSGNRYVANRLVVKLTNADMRPLNVVFQVSNNDIAFRYELLKKGETASMVIAKEATGFAFPAHTTTFLTPQSDAMIGWKRTKPSYEEVYKPDAPLTEPSQYGHGFTFPALFRIGEDGWVLVSETGVGSKYCGSRLSDADANGLFTLEYPMPEENNGNGTAAPGIALPGNTPWRTITVGDRLKPIVETTIPWDVVKPLYETKHTYRYGRGTWSWIMWQDKSINYDDQVRYIDLAAAMGYEYTLIDNWWDKNIGRERMEKLIEYAKSKNVSLFLWYSSSGYWNDITQSPTNIMDDAIARKREMKWLQKVGVKGIKVDFFGGDKQETMRLYESILSDADDHGLMVIFHGCTLPRGWERMYPNYVGSEAVLASENLIFSQQMNDVEAFNASLHPFIRNAVGCMEFGGTLLNKRHNRTNDGGSVRKTTDAFQLATAILFQNPVQFFALAPNNLTDASQVALDFMKEVPTTWDETVFIDGYPGKYCILARRHKDNWYIAGVNAGKEALKLNLNLPMLAKGNKVAHYKDDKQRQLTMDETVVKNPGKVQIVIQPEGGVILVQSN